MSALSSSSRSKADKRKGTNDIMLFSAVALVFLLSPQKIDACDNLLDRTDHQDCVGVVQDSGVIGFLKCFVDLG